MQIRFEPIPTLAARALQRGGLDANGQQPERKTSDGSGVPCRHCLRLVPAGRDYLVLAYRPFSRIHPYAEVGPIFLCADDCPSGSVADRLPLFLTAESYILRGYDADERIVPGTGQITKTAEILGYGQHLLGHSGIAFVHVRSGTNNCFHVRMDRDALADR